MNKKQLMTKISNLGPTEHFEIYKILQQNGVAYSENKNGVFFNLSAMPEALLKEIEAFVSYCYENISELEEYNKMLNECKFRNNINNIVSAPLTSGINEPITKKERIRELMDMTDKTHVIRDFVEKLNTNVEKTIVKKVGTKYTMARKRFAKKVTSDIDLKDDLDFEEYVSA